MIVVMIVKKGCVVIVSKDRNSRRFFDEPPFRCDEYERKLIGKLIFSASFRSGSNITLFDQAAEIVTSEMFELPGLSKIFDVMKSLRDRNIPIESEILFRECFEIDQNKKKTLDVNLFDVIYDLFQIAHESLHIEYYALKVAEYWRKRHAIEMSFEMQRRLCEGESVEEVRAWHDAQIDKEKRRKDETVTHAQEIVSLFYDMEHPEQIREPISSGYQELDKMFSGGFRPGEFVVVAARPSMGKTAFGVNVAINMMKRGVPVYFFSLEMPKRRIIERMLAVQSKVNMSIVQRPDTEVNKQRVMQAANELMQYNPPVFVNDQKGMTVAEIMAKARGLMRQHGNGCVMIDYIGLIQSPHEKKIRSEQVNEISRSLKDLAGRLECPVVALCQINRESGKEKDKRPQLHNLRDSGAIEQDADIVMMLHRDAYYNPDDADKSEAELIVAKNRNGETGKVKLKWRGHCTSFENWPDVNPPE